MSSKWSENEAAPAITEDEIAYIRQLLGQLRRLSDRPGSELLCYLIDMAYIEAGDVQSRLANERCRRH